MSHLLAREAFPEPRTDGAPSAMSFIAQADFDGAIVCTHWSRRDAERLLPPGLTLGRNASAEPGLHPVLFVFGTQAETGLLLAGLPLPTGARFTELMIAVPFVRRADGGTLHVFIPRIYSADRFSAWSGNANYGFNKQLGDMGWIGHTFTVSTRGGPLVAHAIVEPDDAWSPAASVAGLAAVADVFRLPVVGRRTDGREVCSHFEWQLAAASARTARAVVSIDADLGPGLAPVVCHGVQAGTFLVRRMRWRVSWPEPCRS
jgi:hypothetical protein